MRLSRVIELGDLQPGQFPSYKALRYNLKELDLSSLSYKCITEVRQCEIIFLVAHQRHLK